MKENDEVKKWIARVTELVDQAGDTTVLYPEGETPAQIALHGKMARARLMLLCARSLGVLGEQAAALASGVEMVHNASLLHDDVVDQTSMRRSARALHKTHGNKMAIMTGDLCFARAMELICRADHLRVYRAVSRAVVDLSAGQLSEWLNANNASFTVENYFEIVDKKTGSLISLCLELPGILADLGEEEICDLRRAGLLLGRAFQVADDLLDLAPESDRTGKDAFADLAEGKMTYPYLMILQQNDDEAAALIRKAIQEPALRAKAVRDHFHQNGLAEKVNGFLSECLSQARSILSDMLPAESANDLFDYLEMLAFRVR